MNVKFRHPPAVEDRLKKLAHGIEALARKDEERIRRAQEIAELRLRGAREVHSACAEFVASLNRMLSNVSVELSPPEYSDEWFRDPGVNVLQINVSGRLVQITFEATEVLTSTEKIRIPYMLEGAVRCFNQDLLERVALHEMQLYYCLDRGRAVWLLFDPRTQRSTPLDQERLVSFVEQLI
jgi:hypothetical protein